MADGAIRSSSRKKPLPRSNYQAALFAVLLLLFASSSLLLLSLRMPPGLDRSRLARLPRDLEELRGLREHVQGYCREYQPQVIVGFFSVYVLMQCLAIPGTIFLSILAGALFGALKGVAIVVFTATCGASACYGLSGVVGRPIAQWMWPERLAAFREEVARQRSSLFSYMLFLRITPLLPNTFINVASPIVGVPYGHFVAGTLVGLVPGAFLACKAGTALGELRSVRELYDARTVASLFLIGAAAISPRLLVASRKKRGRDMCVKEQ